MHCSSGVRCEFCNNCFSVPEHLAGAALGCVHMSAAEQSLLLSPLQLFIIIISQIWEQLSTVAHKSPS